MSDENAGVKFWLVGRVVGWLGWLVGVVGWLGWLVGVVGLFTFESSSVSILHTSYGDEIPYLQV